MSDMIIFGLLAISSLLLILIAHDSIRMDKEIKKALKEIEEITARMDMIELARLNDWIHRN